MLGELARKPSSLVEHELLRLSRLADDRFAAGLGEPHLPYLGGEGLAAWDACLPTKILYLPRLLGLLGPTLYPEPLLTVTVRPLSQPFFFAFTSPTNDGEGSGWGSAEAGRETHRGLDLDLFLRHGSDRGFRQWRDREPARPVGFANEPAVRRGRAPDLDTVVLFSERKRTFAPEEVEVAEFAGSGMPIGRMVNELLGPLAAALFPRRAHDAIHLVDRRGRPGSALSIVDDTCAIFTRVFTSLRSFAAGTGAAIRPTTATIAAISTNISFMTPP